MSLSYKVIYQIPEEQAGHIRATVNHAFLDSLQVSVPTCVGIVLIAAIVVGWLIPYQRQAHQLAGRSDE
ncbi:hypothetical protein MUBE_14590 [Mycobacterium uberis]|uniref:Uncharacterized protein n=1 Tax=Mycobacterium uberis TaxID=2162698 RepID=A0A3E1HC04_9MYCO|nr:hypothetical protein MUBE_14590 [Mycobacterium uberis]